MSCRASLPVKLEYWPVSTADCGTLPDFESFPEPKAEKKTSQMRFDSKDKEEANLFGISTDKTFATKLTSYFFVREKGTYKVFMLLGQRDTGNDYRNLYRLELYTVSYTVSGSTVSGMRLSWARSVISSSVITGSVVLGESV